MTMTPVPEPSVLLLVAAGLIGLKRGLGRLCAEIILPLAGGVAAALSPKRCASTLPKTHGEEGPSE
jgi:hypothetical protein